MSKNELDQLKADLHHLQTRLAQLEGPAAEEPVNRRNMLRGIGAAAAGAAVGGLAFARPAAAVDGNAIIIGNSTQTANSPTLLIKDATFNSTPLVGMFHVTDDASAGDANAGLVSCITAAATGNGFTTAFSGKGSAYGAKLDAPTPLKLLDSSGSAAPVTGGSGYTGQFKVVDGTLFMCVDHTGLFGDDAEWRRITGPAIAGGFHAVTPGRVHDSRPGNAGAGPLGTGANRTISVANRINPVGGAVVQSNFIPAGATAVTLNITAVTTVGTNGFFAVNPGGTTAVNASSINWFASNQTVANGIVCQLNTSRQLTIVAGGTATSANFIIDITGYYL